MATEAPQEETNEIPKEALRSPGEKVNTAEAERALVPVGVVGMGLIPRTMDEGMKMALMLAKSNMVPKEFQGRPENVYVALQWGSEVGLSPMQALQSIAVINGRPSLWGDAVLALVRRSGLLEKFHEYCENDEQGDATKWTGICKVKRIGMPEVVFRFSHADAVKAKLWDKDSPWRTYPKRMLCVRARGFALRDQFGDVLRGLITREEAEDMEPIPVSTAQPTESIDIYLYELPYEDQERVKKLITTARLTNGQQTTLMKKHKDNPKGFAEEVAALAAKKAGPKATEGEVVEEKPKAKEPEPEPDVEDAAPDVAEVFKPTPEPKSADPEVDSF